MWSNSFRKQRLSSTMIIIAFSPALYSKNINLSLHLLWLHSKILIKSHYCKICIPIKIQTINYYQINNKIIEGIRNRSTEWFHYLLLSTSIRLFSNGYIEWIYLSSILNLVNTLFHCFFVFWVYAGTVELICWYSRKSLEIFRKARFSMYTKRYTSSDGMWNIQTNFQCLEINNQFPSTIQAQ